MIKAKTDSITQLRRAGFVYPTKGAFRERRLVLTLRSLGLPPNKDRDKVVLSEKD